MNIKRSSKARTVGLAVAMSLPVCGFTIVAARSRPAKPWKILKISVQPAPLPPGTLAPHLVCSYRVVIDMQSSAPSFAWQRQEALVSSLTVTQPSAMSQPQGFSGPYGNDPARNNKSATLQSPRAIHAFSLIRSSSLFRGSPPSVPARVMGIISVRRGGAQDQQIPFSHRFLIRGGLEPLQLL